METRKEFIIKEVNSKIKKIDDAQEKLFLLRKAVRENKINDALFYLKALNDSIAHVCNTELLQHKINYSLTGYYRADSFLMGAEINLLQASIASQPVVIMIDCGIADDLKYIIMKTDEAIQCLREALNG